MLEKYREEQPIMYNLLKNAINNNQISHAYLFETNNNSNALDIIYSFVKEIICPKNISCDKCNICSRIDNGNLLDIKVIKPDGLQIKKEQMGELQEEFSKVSLETNRKIYIITECEKMNAQASNSILKFLEEPIDNITAILVTNNINMLLKTIISRCQVISLNKNNYIKKENSLENLANILTDSEKNKIEFLNDERNEELYNFVVDFINFYEDNKEDTIVYIKKKWHENIKDKKDSIFAFDLLINYYYDTLKYKINGQTTIFNEEELIKKISNNSLDNIINKLELFIELRSLIFNNVNNNLIVDYMVLKLEGRR